MRDAAWPLTAIDRFILARLEEKSLGPAPPADRRTLIRRATLGLTGVPPTPDDVAAFVADGSPAAWPCVVDRLLASPRYGERWGRHWLDVVRYADTAGETADYPVPEAYRYRNYVIGAFNADKPYDEFLREQLAGDLLAADMLSAGPVADAETRRRYAERITATGYLAISRRFGFDPQNYHHLTLADTIDTLGRSVLGLSLGCARCHDHKYDPVSMADYYALYGIFDSARYPFPGSEEQKRPHDFVALAPPAEVDVLVAAHQSELNRRNSEVARAEAERKAVEEQFDNLPVDDAPIAPPASEGVNATAPPARDRAVVARLAELKQQLARTSAAHAAAVRERDAWAAQAPRIERAYAMAEAAPHQARIQKRGEPTQPGDEVPRRNLQILGGDPLPPGAKESGRRELADWLTRPSNPLTARTIVNRVWQHHFGRGLVATPSDFGARGQPPSHPELLDYLAARFVAEGWSIKSLHRAILLSRVYQLTSRGDARAAEVDPHNELLGRFPRQRLDAEAIRDAILFVSGGLDATPGEAHPFPPVDTWGFTQHAPFKAVYETNRRSVYLMTQRIARHPFLALFDGADPNSSTDERRPTTTPTQALFMMNDPLVHQESQRLATRLLTEAGDDRGHVELVHQLLFARPATEQEQQHAAAWLARFLEKLPATQVPAAEHRHAAWAGYCRALLASNELLFVD